MFNAIFSADTTAPEKHCKGGASHFYRGLTGMGGTEPYCTDTQV